MRNFFKRIVVSFSLACVLIFYFVGSLHAQATAFDASSSGAQVEYHFPKDEYFNGVVVGVVDKGSEQVGGYTRDYHTVVIRLLDGADKGKTIQVEQGEMPALSSSLYVEKGERVVLVKTRIENEVSYAIIDRYRLTPLFYLGLFFVGLIVIFGGKKGIMSIFGLGFSFVVIGWYMIPRILQGESPFTITLISLLLISFVSLYLAHGFNKRTTLSLISTLMTLLLSIGIAILAVRMTRLTGLGSEEAFFLQLGPLGRTNLQGLLLGGILIGTLGVLDDITTAQTASVEELSKANTSLDIRELYSRGISIGKEHIASLVNTLFLAYAGGALPLFLLFTVNKDQQPLWLTLNSEQLVEEIIRTVVGSSALILAVPISTLLAAYVYGTKKAVENSSTA